MTNFIWAITAGVIVSLISLIGIITVILKTKILDKILVLFIGFSAGGLIGAAFLHILPEALEQSPNNSGISIGAIAMKKYVIYMLLLILIL